MRLGQMHLKKRKSCPHLFPSCSGYLIWFWNTSPSVKSLKIVSMVRSAGEVVGWSSGFKTASLTLLSWSRAPNDFLTDTNWADFFLPESHWPKYIAVGSINLNLSPQNDTLRKVISAKLYQVPAVMMNIKHWIRHRSFSDNIFHDMWFQILFFRFFLQIILKNMMHEFTQKFYLFSNDLNSCSREQLTCLQSQIKASHFIFDCMQRVLS